MKNENKRLYNVIFPVWMLILFPAAWFVVLPSNFIIDSLVLIIAMYAIKLCEKKAFYIKQILKNISFRFAFRCYRSGIYASCGYF